MTVDARQLEAQSSLLDAIRDRQLVVCVGSGGVGKTTTAASIGIRAAIEGKRVIVVTIDPAKRLANSLGLEALGNDERQIDPERFAERGIEPKGQLFAMMLDTRATFNEVISKVPPTLHTPLMSGANAISGISIVGALVVTAQAESSLVEWLGIVAIAMATINVVGGFMVTDRMLQMFKKR